MSSIARDRTRLSEVIARIESLDEPALEESRQRQELLTKPPGSLGRLERLATQLAGITSNARPREDIDTARSRFISRVTLAVFAII